jgi:catechol 2,3-dioxygenase-like lactoylglutathione lyase family enzyme
MSDHKNLHSEQGALTGEHPGRHRDPLVKVHDLAWLEFQKPDLSKAERFAHHFGFTTTLRTDDEVHLRGSQAGAASVILRKGHSTRFLGLAFQAADAGDLDRLARATGAAVRPLPENVGGRTVQLRDPSGQSVQVVYGRTEHPAMPSQPVQVLNFGPELRRSNSPQRPPREPARVERLGHVVLQSNRYRETLDWYLEHFGLIVSDFLFYEGQRERGPTMSFIRCDRGSIPTDHHTLAMALGPTNRYVHSAYQVADLDAMAAGGEHLLHEGYQRSWGIGRHIQGSQIFDYWRDPDGFLVEHFSDGDRFDNTLEPGWESMTASGLAQWGPPATKDFLGLDPRTPAARKELLAMISAFRGDTEFDLTRLRGLIKVGSS